MRSIWNSKRMWACTCESDADYQYYTWIEHLLDVFKRSRYNEEYTINFFSIDYSYKDYNIDRIDFIENLQEVKHELPKYLLWKSRIKAIEMLCNEHLIYDEIRHIIQLFIGPYL